jgi:hypothetical protein
MEAAIMSSQSLLQFAVASILLGSCVASAQAQRGGAYPMNTEDRINAITSDGDNDGYGDNGRSITAAGAYPMNTMDRINATRRSYSAPKSNALSNALKSDTTKTSEMAGTPSLKDRPDAWRYRWHRNQWWYYGANNQWSYWTGNHWNAYQTASAAEHDATGHAH